MADLTTPPVLIEADPYNILQEVLATFEDVTGKIPLPGQPEYINIVAPMAYHIYLERQRLNAAAQNMLIDFASAPMLDYLVAWLGITRIIPKPATCSILFTLVTGHGGVIIPIGTRVTSTDGEVIFATDEETTVASGTDEVTIDATCQTDGIIGNDYEAGSISVILDPQAFLSAAENTDTTANGSDAESDADLKERSKLASAAFSVAGPSDAYKYYTYAVNSLIVDVAVLNVEDDGSIDEGTVNIVPLLADGVVPSASILSDVEDALTSDKIRPMNDTVVAVAPTDRHYTLEIDVVKLDSYTAITTLEETIEAALEAYNIEKYAKLGNDIVASDIESRCRVALGAGVIYDITATITPITGSLTGNNLVLDPDEFGILDSSTINVTSAPG